MNNFRTIVSIYFLYFKKYLYFTNRRVLIKFLLYNFEFLKFYMFRPCMPYMDTVVFSTWKSQQHPNYILYSYYQKDHYTLNEPKNTNCLLGSSTHKVLEKWRHLIFLISILLMFCFHIQ